MTKHKIFIFQLVIVAIHLGTSYSEEPTTTSTADKPVVVWKAEETTCPLTDARPFEDIEDPGLHVFAVDGTATEPRLGSHFHFGDFDWNQHFDCFRQRVGRSVYQLVINRAGAVEEIVRLRDQPDCWTAAMVDHIRSWEIEPATIAGEPVCVAYIISFSLHPY